MGDCEGEEPHAQGLALLLLLQHLLQLLHLAPLWNSLVLLLIPHLACSPPSYSPVDKSEYTEKKRVKTSDKISSRQYSFEIFSCSQTVHWEGRGRQPLAIAQCFHRLLYTWIHSCHIDIVFWLRVKAQKSQMR